MKIAVFGATGHTGRLVLDQGIQRGHAMTACTRRPDALAGVHGLHAIVAGDGRDRATVLAAVHEQDAIISILSSPGLRPSVVVRDVTRTIVTALQETDCRRLICVSAHPLVATRPRLLVGIVKWIFRHPYADLADMEQVVTSSSLDWIIVRPTRLVNGSATGRVQMVHNQRDFPTGPYQIRRADLAMVLLNVAEQEDYSKTTLEVTGSH
jgi:putative NADH-flavin reductase